MGRLVSHAISSFIGGVSQQAASVRHPSQVEAMDNCVPSVASGLRKRTGHQFINKLFTGGDDHQFALVHPINRGTSGITERYFVVINNGTLQVFDFRGNPIPVAFPDGIGYLTGDFNARDNFKCTTVADYTFVTHTNVPVIMQAAVPNTPSTKVYVVVKLGVVNQSYFVALNGSSYSYTAGATTAKTIDIATGLASAITAGGQFTVSQSGNLLELTPNIGVPAAYQWSVNDTYGDTALFAFRDTVARYEDLPATFFEGPVIKVTGGPDASQTGYYVTWTAAGHTEHGVWQECVQPGIATSFYPSQMPHVLIRESDGTFTFKEADWKSRETGDDLSNPLPSFVGTNISDVFFYRNRLCFLADENVIMSQAADYFNFWATSARVVTDADPIDVSSSSNQVTFLRHAIPFSQGLLVFSDKAQFQFVDGDTLKGSTARLKQTTSYEASPACRPTALGKDVFFVTNRGQFTAVREYYFDGNSVLNDAEDVTAHVPSYLPQGIFKLTAAPTEDMLFALSTQQRNVVYVYNSKWQGDQKAQSAWHQWVFDPADLIISVDVFASTLCFTVQRDDGVYIDMMELEEKPYTPTVFNLCIDRWVGYETGTYDANQKKTFWTLPYLMPVSGARPVVVVCTKAGELGQGLEPEVSSRNVVSLNGDYREQTVVIGLKYDASITLSELFVRDQKDTAVVNARLQLRDMTVRFNDTGYFYALVTAKGRDPMRFDYTGKKLGLASMIIGREVVDAGEFKFPIMCRSSDATVELHNDSHLPSIFLSAAWQGHVSLQANPQ
jgi:hypothetical protein